MIHEKTPLTLLYSVTLSIRRLQELGLGRVPCLRPGGAGTRGTVCHLEDQGQYAYIVENDSPLGFNNAWATCSPLAWQRDALARLLGTSEPVYEIGGTARIQSDNETLTLSAGELALLREEVPQSIDAVGPSELRYLSVNQPPYRSGIDICGTDLANVSVPAGRVPIAVRNPAEGIGWDHHTGTLNYTLLNPVLMPEKDIPHHYGVAYAEILPRRTGHKEPAVRSIRANPCN